MGTISTFHSNTNIATTVSKIARHLRQSRPAMLDWFPWNLSRIKM
jgi:hypothetical protein